MKNRGEDISIFSDISSGPASGSVIKSKKVDEELVPILGHGGTEIISSIFLIPQI